ncbi:MAG: type I phosphomannose isomerase catalytic subunit [Flavobacteriaceae bacterium]|nr:type I phosphomannose isomerase catalytic subunit [Flavobacteriaceae bacterium]
MDNNLYPLKFEPILKEKIWGGNKLKEILDKPTISRRTGESWEISGVEGDISVVKNGPLKGKSLSDIIKQYQGRLLGKRVYQNFGEKFPLLIKFIDARENLSVQLHPNDKIAAKLHNSFGKTEMWYVVQADKNSNLIVGFKEGVDKSTYLKHLQDKNLSEILNFEKVEAGDSYFIEVGRVHAIGSGILLAEIQQTSDITYRIYDWDRVDDEGNSRELHTDLALQAINFEMRDDFRRDYNDIPNKSSNMVQCNYFTTNFVHVTKKYNISNGIDSFRIYMNVEGEAKLHWNDGETNLNFGETILVPATLDSCYFTSESAKLLEVYI